MPQTGPHFSGRHFSGMWTNGTVLLCLVVICALTLQSHAQQSHCDPKTQYELDGKCCTMCGPGTSMVAQSTCDQPQCSPCREDEFQETYTKEPKCKRQPYCDPNSNFGVPVHKVTKRTTCMCKDGFHCSSQECMTCLRHSTCGVGSGVRFRGNHSYDTICEKCPAGKYSDETSADGVCKEWTKCGEKQHVQLQGTEKSDNICVDNVRKHEIAITLVLIFSVVLIIIAIAWLIYRRRNRGEMKNVEILNNSDEGYITGETRLPEEPRGPITTPDEYPSDPVEIDEGMQHGNGRPRVYTNTGKIVTEEEGKTEIVSFPESDAFIRS